MYDLEQMNMDLSLIVRHLGKKAQHGYFTVGTYEDHTVRIVDTYIDPNGPEIYLKHDNKFTRLAKPFNTECWAGSRILSLAVNIEDTVAQ